ncbi:L,D-transpeptidase family protein [Candidatus Parcubacteria bacterium]|nr:L,D-transpeptidase family protein [Candidatus Parcubacteria bacterium]
MPDKSESSVKLYSYADDLPKNGKGMLIPRPKQTPPTHTFTPMSARKTSSRSLKRVAVVVAGVAAIILVSMTGYGLVAQQNLAAAPTVTIVNPYDQRTTELTYGPQEAFSREALFTGTRDSFIDEGITFIEVDLTKEQLRFFKKGVLYQSATIVRTSETGSWWDTPSGLYKIEKKTPEFFTNIGQVYFPWVLSFEKNFIIHGWPTYPGDRPVSADFTGGGIRLDDAAAEALYSAVSVGTPVLVHKRQEQTAKVFVYEPQVPDIDTKHYFIADIENGTVMAATNLDQPVPIASLTKLMTAVVAAEQLDLDGRVKAVAPTFVTTLIPRLEGRTSVSLYSLLQLLLVESSNEAAETIAGEMGRAGFIAAMNTKARQLGMLHTNFADPSGLSAENTASLGDLYTLTRYIYENRRFIFELTANTNLASAHVGGEFDGLINFNEVKDMDNFIGGKVGETLAAGQTSISLHRLSFQGQERILAVILLGSTNRTSDVQALIAYVQNRFGN